MWSILARTLGSEIRKVRELRGLSLNAAATPAGFSATYLQKLERDQVESPSPHRLHRLAEALGLDYADLFRLAGYPLPSSARTHDGEADSLVDTAGEPDSGSLLRKAFQSPEFITDEELDHVAHYLAFLRNQRRAGFEVSGGTNPKG